MPKCLAAARMVVWCSMMYTANSRALCSMLSRITNTSHHRSRKVYGCPRAVMTRQTGIMCSFRSKTPESFYLQGSGAMFKRRKPQSRVWGRHSPTSFPRGAKPQNCGFWHRGTGRGFQPAVRGPFFFPLKIHFKGRQLPAGRGFFKISFALVSRETGFWQPAGQENFLPHSLLHLARG